MQCNQWVVLVDFKLIFFHNFLTELKISPRSSSTSSFSFQKNKNCKVQHRERERERERASLAAALTKRDHGTEEKD
jgi:hypothetical protein